MNLINSIRNNALFSDHGFLVFIGGFFIILILIGMANKSGRRGSGRYANLREILTQMGNWARFPLAPLMFLFILLGLMSLFALVSYQVDSKILINVQKRWAAYLGAILICSILVFFLFFETALIKADRNRFPLGKKRGVFSLPLSLPEKARFEHIRIMGRAGTGKTSSFMFPQLLEDAGGQCTSIFLDVKSPEAYDLIAGAWAKRGKKVILFDPFHKDCIGFEPLASVDERGLAQIVETVYGKFNTEQNETSKWFETQERRFFSLLCQLVMGFKNPEQRSLPMVYQLASRGIPAIEGAITYSGNTALQEELEPYFKNSSRLGDVISGVLNRLDLFAQPEIAAAFSRPDLDISLLFREPVLLLIASPHSNPKAQLGASILLRAIMQKVYEHPVRTEKDGVSVFFYLDEFYALHLPDLAAFANTARSARVGLVTGLQSADQLLRYQRHEVATIAINNKTQIYLQGCDLQTCKNLSDQLGKCVIRDKRRSRSMKAGSVISVGQVETYLESPDSIQNLPANQALVFSGGMRGLKIRQTPFYKTKRYKKEIGLPVSAYRPNRHPLKQPHFKDIDLPALDLEGSEEGDRGPKFNTEQGQDVHAWGE